MVKIRTAISLAYNNAKCNKLCSLCAILHNIMAHVPLNRDTTHLSEVYKSEDIGTHRGQTQKQTNDTSVFRRLEFCKSGKRKPVSFL